jgi:hypothetical protein
VALSFLAFALLVAVLRLRPAAPPVHELRRCATPGGHLEGGRLLVDCGRAVPPARDLPPGARLLLGLPVELNSASEVELQSLPRIGPVLSRRIVEARRARVFCSLDDLARVRGIGLATLRRLAPIVSVVRPAGCGGAGGP